MTSEEFKKSDVVRLRSGGPRMTVVDIGMYGGELRAKCQWFAGERMDELKEDVFYLEALKLVDD
jgi:uncharacterized protein YodC (DUF2158 family)